MSFNIYKCLIRVIVICRHLKNIRNVYVSDVVLYDSINSAKCIMISLSKFSFHVCKSKEHGFLAAAPSKRCI